MSIVKEETFGRSDCRKPAIWHAEDRKKKPDLLTWIVRQWIRIRKQADPQSTDTRWRTNDCNIDDCMSTTAPHFESPLFFLFSAFYLRLFPSSPHRTVRVVVQDA